MKHSTDQLPRDIFPPPADALNKMKKPEKFEVLETHSRYSPAGIVSLEEGVELVTSAIRYCRHQNIRRLLVDSTGLVGFPPPMIHERYWFAKEWAHAARGGVIVALVAREELLDPHRFGVLVAKNNGMTSFASSGEKEAVDWLLAQKI